ncbi:unnamed protein product [Hermetia illucens]|uniref:Cytochrome P450 n=2 Tax=Hermetia illucens TaxID=343691 RepID=A0A7R8YSL4_HERIL|nr:probable cytochrome P450 6a23 isoform X1 [Hermetia illucens]CAD7083746.1 unnamed protein product [Hermetia illucens]
MDFLVVLVSILTVALVFVLWIRKKHAFWRELGVPYVEPHFFYGNFKDVDQYQHDGQFIQRFYQKYKGRSPLIGMYTFLKPVAVAIDIELVKNILIKDFNSFHDHGTYYNEKDDPLSANLFNLPGTKWRQLRHKLKTAFTTGKVEMMFGTMWGVAKKFESKIGEACETGGEFHNRKLMTRFTIDVIGSCVFGVETNSLEDENNGFFQVGMSIFHNPRHGMRFIFLLNVFRDYARKLRFKLFRDEVIEFYTRIVRETVDYRLANHVERNDFMQLLIKLYTSKGEDKLSFNELLAQAFVFHMAGFETASTTLQFCFYELACNPEIQDRVRNHIKEVLENHNGQLTYEALMDMKYLEQVLHETLRKYPPIGLLPREASQDYKIPNTKFVLKKGINVIIPAYAIHHDPEFYPNPSIFNPDNFSEEAVKNRPLVAFLPFGEGPRICIGARVGMMQTKMGVIAGLRKFRYTLSPRTKQPLKLLSKFNVIYPEEDVWLNVERIG